MIREALDRMALGERAVLAGVEVERVSLFGYLVGGWAWRLSINEAQRQVAAWSIPAVQTEEGDAAEIEQAGRGVVAAPAKQETSVVGEPRKKERLRAGAPETTARIEALRRQHGRALRVTGGARAKRARWTGMEAWLVVSYPKEAT